ncbi:hypothetical protein QM467_11615 [Rhodoblastus sp. 17X3]|uniref:hypothetical protein n=1 Tax=Rhodoblastus sp. 17X3 TaxID=3047026 RepID=UPI0024B79BBD|nr:hypothetical protein [Rhodoblastus sp. 17X3]MDI9848703.1 hypothetical protein [Rhodoblastus sp. 17X3]
MPRELVHVALAAPRPQDLAKKWARLGFALDASGVGVALADGVALDFIGSKDPASRRALVGLSADELVASAAPADPAASSFQLAAARLSVAPRHPNGALGLRAIVALADGPSDHAEYLSALIGQREMVATSAGLEIHLDGGTSLDVLSAPAFAYRFGAAPQTEGFRVAGLVFAVKDTAETEAVLRANGLAPRHQAGRLLAETIDGVAVAFEQA